MSSDMNSAIQTGPGFMPQSGFVRDVLSADVWLAALPVLKFDEFVARRTELGTANGRVIVMNKLGAIKRGGPLQEGQRIQLRSMSNSTTSITVGERGNAVGFTEELIRSSFVDVMAAASILLGRDMAIVLDLELRNAVLTSPNVIYANGRAARTQILSTDLLTTSDIRRAVEILDTNNTPRFGDYLVGFIHPHVASNLRADDDWIEAHKYAAVEGLFRGEIGMWEGVRFVVTGVMPNGANLAKDPNTGDYVNLGADPALANGTAGNQTAIYKSVIFGMAAIAHAIGAPPEMRTSRGEDFDREWGIAWYGRWGAGLYEASNAVVVESA